MRIKLQEIKIHILIQYQKQKEFKISKIQNYKEINSHLYFNHTEIKINHN